MASSSGIGGMSLRDYFAGQALVGMLGNPMYDENSSANVAQQAHAGRRDVQGAQCLSSTGRWPKPAAFA